MVLDRPTEPCIPGKTVLRHKTVSNLHIVNIKEKKALKMPIPGLRGRCSFPQLNEHQPLRTSQPFPSLVPTLARFIVKTHNELITHEAAPMSESAINQQS